MNPNSSSLGVDVTYLLVGGAGVYAAMMFLGSLLRRGRRTIEVIGEPMEQPTCE